MQGNFRFLVLIKNVSKKSIFKMVITGWERNKSQISAVPEEYGWANGYYFEAERGR